MLLNPQFTNAYRNRGFVRAQLGQNQKAIEDYEKAARLYNAQGDTQSYQELQQIIQTLQDGPPIQ